MKRYGSNGGKGWAREKTGIYLIEYKLNTYGKY
jgi:hypothetical protein